MRIQDKPWESRNFGEYGKMGYLVVTDVPQNESVEIEGYPKGQAPSLEGTYDGYIILKDCVFIEWKWIRK